MLTEAAKKFIFSIQNSDIKTLYLKDDSLSKVQVDSLVSKLAFIYEKVRTAIEYKEEHLIRQSAILRILQRRLLIKVSIENLGISLVKELIRAGYLENGLVPLDKVEKVNKIIEKYLAVINLSNISFTNHRGRVLHKWLMEIAACEIEECLMPPLANWAVVEFAHKIFYPKLDIQDDALTEKQKNLYVYLALYRALVKSDEGMMNYHLLKYYYSNWGKANPDEVMEVAKKLNNLRLAIEKFKKYYLYDRLYHLFKKYTFVFFNLKELILKDPAEAEAIFKDHDKFKKELEKICTDFYKKTRGKLRRSIVRVTIYIFITKMALVLLLELPYEYYIVKHVTYLPFYINALFPPLLMLFLGIFIKTPSQKNTDQVIKLADGIIYKNDVVDLKNGFDITPSRSFFFGVVFNVLYVILFTISFGFFVYFLRKLNFNFFSLTIFLLFLSIVSFFGIKMRMKVRELMVIDRKDNLLFLLLNLFSLPFLKVGQFVSEKIAKINIFVFIFDFIIEAPFKVFLEVIEDWFAFLKKKKDEIYNNE